MADRRFRLDGPTGLKIILSRKAFDSGSGGVPNPILPDGRMMPLPIPDRQSPVRYCDIQWDGINVGEVVSALTRGRIPPTHFAHVDPDLNANSLPRDRSWTPLFGQDGPAQGHLRNHGVGPGDLFLFFGLFRPVVVTASGLAWERGSQSRHLLWGWLQVGSVVAVDQCPPGDLPWARYHPHFHRKPSPLNTLYVAADRLELPGSASDQPGAAHFPHVHPDLQLTAGAARRPGDWDLPGWMLPRPGRPALTYHAHPDRWTPDGDRVRLSTVGRGQEFILNADDHPEAVNWATSIIGLAAR